LRVLVLAGCGSLALVASGALASDVRARAQTARPTFVSEVRLGGFAHDPWGPERGSANLSAEILLRRPFTPADLFTSYFVPRPHLGGSLVFGRTSFAYTGLTWTFDLAPRLFVEGSLGGALHNGSTSEVFVPPGRAALGCTPLFRESGSVGVKLSASWSLMATVEHLSNYGLCSENRGLTNIGARLGYTF
jgi:lipid A 3-O-deacylase